MLVNQNGPSKAKGVNNQFEREHKREIRRHRDFDRER